VVLPQQSTKMEDLASDLDTGFSTLLSSFWEEEGCIRFFWHCLMTRVVFRVPYQDRQQEIIAVRSIGKFLMLPSNSAFIHLFNAG